MPLQSSFLDPHPALQVQYLRSRVSVSVSHCQQLRPPPPESDEERSEQEEEEGGEHDDVVDFTPRQLRGAKNGELLLFWIFFGHKDFTFFSDSLSVGFRYVSFLKVII